MVDFQSRDRRPDRDAPAETDDEGVADEGADASPEQGEEGTTEYGADTLPFAVVTVTGERTVDDDAAGDAVVEAIETAGEVVSTRELLSPSYDGVQATLGTLVDRKDVDAVVTVGGTGVEPDDVTVDAATDIFDKHLPGFGELFRVLSHETVGTATVRTRTTAGIVDGVPVFCLPGDTTSARRGVEQLVLEEAGALVNDADNSADRPA